MATKVTTKVTKRSPCNFGCPEGAALPVRHYHASWEATTGDAGVRQEFGKVYIDGIGYMKDGRRLRDGREKADARKLYRARP